MALHHTVTSGTSNVLKARVFEEAFAELGVGFVEKNSTFQPWLVLHFGGAYEKVRGSYDFDICEKNDQIMIRS